jgi:hypothetical protein
MHRVLAWAGTQCLCVVPVPVSSCCCCQLRDRWRAGAAQQLWGRPTAPPGGPPPPCWCYHNSDTRQIPVIHNNPITSFSGKLKMGLRRHCLFICDAKTVQNFCRIFGTKCTAGSAKVPDIAFSFAMQSCPKFLSDFWYEMYGRLS